MKVLVLGADMSQNLDILDRDLKIMTENFIKFKKGKCNAMIFGQEY